MNYDVLCIGSFFTRNYGDRAIFQVIKRALFSQAGLRARPFPLKPIFVNRHGSSMGFIQKIFMGILLLPRHYVGLYKRARAAKAVVIGGGNLIHDVYPFTVVQFLLTCLVVRAAGRKFWIFAIGAGPLQRRISRACISMACRLSAGVIVRDSYSFSVLKQCWGIENRLQPEIVPDVVLTMERKEDRSPNTPVCIGVSTMFYMMPQRYQGGKAEAYEVYLDRMENLIRLIVGRLKAQVLLFSTEPSEDQETVNELAKRVSDLKEVRAAKVKSLPSAIRITGSCDYHVGTRLHSLIFSLAQGVPAVALTSHGRITGLYTDLKAKDLLFDIANFDASSVVDALERLMGERGNRLLENVGQRRKEAVKGIANIVEEIHNAVHKQK